MTKNKRKQTSFDTLKGEEEVPREVSKVQDLTVEEGPEYEKNNRLLGDWLDIGYNNPRTKDGYYSVIQKFLTIIYPDEEIQKTEDMMNIKISKEKTREAMKHRKNRIEYFLDKYVAEDRVFLDDYRNCVHALIKQDYAPTTINTYMSQIKFFFEMQDQDKYEIEKRDLANIKRSLIPANRPATQDEILTKEEAKKVINYLPVMYRAIILFLASTGVRIEAALAIRIESLMLDADPPWVNIPGADTKGGVGGRKVWFTTETRDAIDAWLKVLMYVHPKTGLRKKAGRAGAFNREMLFDVSESTVNKVYTRALKKAGLDKRDPNTKKRTRIYHIHTLRKFFSTEMGEAGMPESTVNALMGHTGGYLTKEYKRPKELARKYVKWMHAVTIFEKDLETEMRKKLANGETEIQDLQKESQETKMTLSIIAMNLDISNPHELSSDSMLIQINMAIAKLKETLAGNIEEIAYLKETGRSSQ